jgi:hypothetical protein
MGRRWTILNDSWQLLAGRIIKASTHGVWNS